jgi:hypothetical protein
LSHEAKSHIETSIPSFYHDRRQSPNILARRGWTRQWWDSAADSYDLVTSAAVLDEIVGDIAEQTSLRQELMIGVPLLPVDDVIAEIVQFYIQHKLMPADLRVMRYIWRSQAIISATSCSHGIADTWRTPINSAIFEG